MNTVLTVGLNCKRVEDTVGSSRGLTLIIWDIGEQERYQICNNVGKISRQLIP